MCSYQDFQGGLVSRPLMVNGTDHPFADIRLTQLPCGMNDLYVHHYHIIETSLLSHNLHLAEVV